MPKIPLHAKKVFSGVIFDVYHYDQKMYDGSTETFEILKRPNTVVVIPTDKNHIFLIEEEQPNKGSYLAMPGGRQEKREDSLTTAKRELIEETGLTSTDWELWHSVEPYTKIDWTIYIYIARNCKKVSKLHLDAGEKITVHTVSFDEWVAQVLDKRFHEFEITQQVLRMKLHPEKLELFRKKLY